MFELVYGELFAHVSFVHEAPGPTVRAVLSQQNTTR